MEVNGIITYDEDTCRLCMTPHSGVININSSISSKSGRIIDMVRYCYDIEVSGKVEMSNLSRRLKIIMNIVYVLHQVVRLYYLISPNNRVPFPAHFQTSSKRENWSIKSSLLSSYFTIENDGSKT